MSIDGNFTIDQKMEEMRRKNLELLKRHQEIEEDRQLAERVNQSAESIKFKKADKGTMRHTNKNRTKAFANQQHSQENQYERHQRTSAVRRKLIQDPNEIQPQNVQSIDYHRFKNDRIQESLTDRSKSDEKSSIKSELLDYVYPSEDRICDHHDIDEPTRAKKRVIVNHQANRIGSGRFNQSQQQQQQQQSKQISREQQRLKTERMRRFGLQNLGNSDEIPEFHLEMPQLNMWQNASMPPPSLPMTHLHLLPSTMNGQSTGSDHIIGDNNEQMEQSNFLPNYIFSSSINSSPFNNSGPVFFTQAPPLMSTNAQSSQGQSLLQPQPQYPTYHPSRTFDNSNRTVFQHHSPFQTSNMFQNPAQLTSSIAPIQFLTSSSSNGMHNHGKTDESSNDLQPPPRFRRPKGQDYEDRFAQSRPMSGDFERLTSGQNLPSSSNVNLRFNYDHRAQSRPQSFYEFSSHSSSFNNNVRSSNNHQRYQRNNNYNGNTNLPLSAYMNVDDSSHINETNNQPQWNTSNTRRRTYIQRTPQQERHKFPLSCYDPRQYGFVGVNQKRNENNQRSTGDTKNMSESNEIDLIEDWWEDDNKNSSEKQQNLTNNDSSSTTTSTNSSFAATNATNSSITTTTLNITMNDSGNSSLSTSIHLKESTLDDDDNNPSSRDVVSPPSDLSTTDSNIVESLDKLQQELKFEESLEKHLALNDELSDDIIDPNLLATYKESGGFDTAHFMQWAKEKFREELAGRLTAQQIQQHDAVITDDDDDDENVDDLVLSVPIDTDFHISSQLIDDEHAENIDDLKNNLQYKLIIDELVSLKKEDIVVTE